MRLVYWGVILLVLGFAGVAVSAFNVVGLVLFSLIAFLGIIVSVVGVIQYAIQSHRRSRRTYGRQTTTHQGETVRSASEGRIADYFTKNNIKYVYEQSARGHGRRISRPDFFLPDYGVYVEYWGLVDAEDSHLRSRYVRTMKWKMAMYYKNNIKFVSIYPSNMKNLDYVFRSKFKEVAGHELPSSVQAQANPSYCSSCGVSLAPSTKFCGNCGSRIWIPGPRSV